MTEIMKFKEKGWRVVGSAAALAGAAALTGCDGSKSTETVISGKVECSSGRDVEGVYIDADKSKAGWAEWASLAGKENTASFRYKLDKGGNYSVHVGCGGMPSDWESSTWSDSVSSKEHHDFICHDSKSRPSSQPLIACESVQSLPEAHITTVSSHGSDVLLANSNHREIVQFSTGSKTFEDYKHYSGEGPTLRQYEAVDVDCLIIDPQEAGDSTRGKWYHLIGPKAVRGLFTPSNNFENGINDPNSGPAADPKVPDCPPS
jgi:hypothetical protein